MGIEGNCSATLLVTINHPARTVELKFDGAHSHSLDDSDCKKTSPAVKDALISHLSFGYKSCQVNSVFKKEFSGTGLGVEYLKYQDVANLRRKVIQDEGINTLKDLEKDIKGKYAFIYNSMANRKPSEIRTSCIN